MDIKEIYDEEGLERCAALFAYMMKCDNSKRMAKLILFLIQIVYKLDSCHSTCFENLEKKDRLYCPCDNEPMTIPFDLDKFIGEA